ncbi:MAG: VOC family protein [Bryobacteraceae bacterium]|nr:VOC family protein [Bryobacteraceae bacterium]
MRILPVLLALPLLAAETPTPMETLKPVLDIGIVVSDPAKAKEFYGEILGLKASATLPMPGGGEMQRFPFGGSTLKLVSAAPNAPKYAGPIRDAIGFRLLTLVMNDCKPIVERMKAKGMAEPKWNGSDIKYAFVSDPDGNVIELVEIADPARNGMVQLGFTVSDSARTRAFYREILGLTEQEPRKTTTGAPLYRFEAGKSIVKFWDGAKGLPVRTGSPFDAVGLRYYTFMVKDVDAVHDILVKRGAKIGMPPSDFGKLARIMFVADPDGNWVEFAGPQKKQ